MTTSPEVDAIAAACVKAQQELKPAIKDAVNPAFKSRYADLAAVIEASRAYSQHGVAIFQEVVSVEKGVAVSTRLVHSSGQWIAFEPLTVPLAKQDAHGMGSACTYGKRYALSAALNLSADDDDGNAAVGKEKPAEKAAKAAPQELPPAGYDNWLLDLTAVADNGLPALRGAWKGSPATHREYLEKTDALRWAKLKAKATVRTPPEVPA